VLTGVNIKEKRIENMRINPIKKDWCRR